MCVSNELEDLSLNDFNMITGINESKTLKNHISCKCECKFDGRKCNSHQKWNNDKYWCECKNPNKHRVCQKYYICNPATCRCKNSKYAGGIIDDSVVYMWWNHRRSKNCFKKKYFNKSRSNKIRSSENPFKKSHFNKMHFNKFLHFTSLFY